MIASGILELIDGYLDGTADASAVSQLRQWLAQDKANVHLFARQVYLHRQLREILVAENTAECLAAANCEEPAADRAATNHPRAAKTNRASSSSGLRP